MSDSGPDSAVAVILGASAFPDHEDLVDSPNFAASAAAFRDYLHHQFGLPTQQLLDLFDTVDDLSAVSKRLAGFLRERSDARDLILYYVGHGAFSERDEYFLALRSTEIQRPYFTGLPVVLLASILREHAGDLRRFIILDSCFAGAAASAFMSTVAQAAQVQLRDALPESGTALIAASSATMPADLDPAGQLTMFTGALHHVLTEGDPELEPLLSCSRVVESVNRQLERTHGGRAVRSEIHVPDHAWGSVAEIPLFPNPAARLEAVQRRLAAERAENEELRAALAQELTGARTPGYETATPKADRTEPLRIPDSFGAWLFDGTLPQTVLALAAVIALVSIGASLSASIRLSAWFLPTVLGLQTAFIFGLLLAVGEPVVFSDEARPTAAVRQFRRSWWWLWMAWLVLYVGLTSYAVADRVFGYEPVVSDLTALRSGVFVLPLRNLLNNVPSVFLLICALIASRRTVRDRAGNEPEKLPWILLFTGVAVLFAAEAGVRWLELTGQTDGPYAGVFGWAGGFIAALATAMLAGRLDSKFIGLSTPVTGLVYAYAVIQPGWGSFDDSLGIRTLLLSSALLLKAVLFLVVAWLLESGVLLYYMARIGRIFDDVAPDRRAFLRRAQGTGGRLGPEFE